MLEKILYQEFTIPLKDYFSTLKINEAIFEWLIPIIIAIIFYFSMSDVSATTNISVFIGGIVGLLAVLIGFSIASVTILLGSNNEAIMEMKKNLTNREIDGKKISLYHLIYITFISVILIEIFTLFLNLGIYFDSEILGALLSYKRILISIDVVLLLSIFLLNIRNITNLYFMFYPKSLGYNK